MTGSPSDSVAICSYCHEPKNTGHCKSCGHELWFEEKLKVGPLTVISCGADSQFVCGCPGEGNRLMRPICSICGKDFGNMTCLSYHLDLSSSMNKYYAPHHTPEEVATFKPEYYRR